MSNKMNVSAAGRHTLTIPVAKAFWETINGQEGERRRKIEEEANVDILIPRPNDDRDIIIQGRYTQDVISAAEKINAIITKARAKIFATHIVTLPVATDEVKANFAIFKERAIRIQPNIGENVFKPPDHLHFTFARLVIKDKREREQAAKHFERLKDLVSKILDGNELEVEIRGIFTDSDDPAHAKSVMATCDCPLLEKISKAADKYMNELGFSKHYWGPRKPLLRATVMKARYAEKRERTRASFNKLKGMTFDVCNILEELRDFDFGTIKLRTLHLSDVECEEIGSDGYFLPASAIHFD